MKNKKIIIISTLFIIFAAALAAFYFIRSNQKTEETTKRNCTTFVGIEGIRCTDDYIGLSRLDAEAKAKKDGLIPKITLVDGVGQVNTDEGSSPIYFEVKNDLVTKAYFEKDRN